MKHRKHHGKIAEGGLARSTDAGNLAAVARHAAGQKGTAVIGKLAEAGWKTNDDFPIFRPETDWNCGG